MSKVTLLVTIALSLVLLANAIFDTNSSTTTTEHKKPKKLISLAESIKISRKSLRDPEVEKRRRESWEKALNEIRLIGIPKHLQNDTTASSSSSQSNGFLAQWKLLLDDQPVSAANATISKGTITTSAGNNRMKMPRFEGFASWERKLQEWSDDVQEYLDKVKAETEKSINSSTLPILDAVEALGNETLKSVNNIADALIEAPTPEEMTATAGSLVKNKVAMPIPRPARPDESVLPHTDLRDKSKRIEVVTTAALPWRTGTAVNPLLRAAYLVEGRKEHGGSVTLMLPWLERSGDQEKVYGSHMFENYDEQEQYIRTWLKDSANMDEASRELKIRWYTAWNNPAENSIYSMGDITALIPAEDVDICILEEPEHLNWYRAPGESWTKKFKHVVGIVHTNYFQYAMDAPGALVRAPAMRLLVSWMCRAHCHRIIKLSGTLDKFAPEKELVENVHGVRNTFIQAGEDLRHRLSNSANITDPVFGATAPPTIYFIGKLLWSKGIGSLMELLLYAEESAGIRVNVDIYGSGPERDQMEVKAKALDVALDFKGPLDHAELADTHKIFFNPSVSEVLCTTSAEALAMGKFVILPSHPSNDFFAQFPNCLAYSSKEEFVGNLYYAMTHSPQPMAPEFLYALSWKAANERLEAASCISEQEAQEVAAAHEAEMAGIEIPLPPLVESEERRQAISNTFKNTRDRYRQFRTRLSHELQQSKVLPNTVRNRLAVELNKRLDFDIDEVLESPKLRLKLSPAELDKSLLEFYDRVSESPGGDILRVIGGGGSIGLQNLYIKRLAQKERKTKGGPKQDLFPSFPDWDGLENNRAPSIWVRRALKRTLNENGSSEGGTGSKAVNGESKIDTTTKMSLLTSTRPAFYKPMATSHTSFTPPTKRSSSGLKLLI